jgi:transcriptional regulator with XRE-family HTH domain
MVYLKENQGGYMNLKELRVRTGRTQEAMAELLEVSLSTLRNWERGRAMLSPPVVEIPKYLDAYQCDLETLVKAIWLSKDEACYKSA